MKITSQAFGDHELIPEEYTCDADDLIPPLSFDEVPPDTKSLALIMDDPDVPRNLRPDGNWDHWVMWNIPPDTRRVERGKPPAGVEGKNSWGRNDYGGPCPPDKEHRYFFKLLALDSELELSAETGKEGLLIAMAGHVIEKAELVGVYDKRIRREGARDT